jgi:hypothetical protein
VRRLRQFGYCDRVGELVPIPQASELDQIPRIDGKIWLPDLVGWLWGKLRFEWVHVWNKQMFPTDDDAETLDLLKDQGERWRHGIVSHDDPGFVPESVIADVAGALGSKVVDPDAKAEDLLRLLVAADRAASGLGLLDPRVPPATAGSTSVVGALILHWEVDRTLNRARKFPRVLRSATPRRGVHELAHYLKNFWVIEEEVGQFDIDVKTAAEPPLVGSADPATGLVEFAFVPILESADDATFRKSGSKEFAIELDQERQKELASGFEALVFQLETEGVKVALLPEACLEQDALDKLRGALRVNYDKHKKSPSLRLVLVGCAGERRNEVVVLNGLGNTVGSQRKQHPWALDERQQRRYGLDPAFAGRFEALERLPASFIVIEEPRFGRLVVLICEDVRRHSTAGQFPGAVGATHVVSPVMDASLEFGRWSAQAAHHLAGEPEMVVLVVNSLFLTELADRVGVEARRPPHDKCCEPPGIGHVTFPGDRPDPECKPLKRLAIGGPRFVKEPIPYSKYDWWVTSRRALTPSGGRA